MAYANGESEAAWNMPAYYYPGESETELTFDWGNLYGSLEAGDYRIIKEIDNTYIAGEFTIE